ncbi:Histone H3.2, partial [Durusdinium trenchii]
HGANQDDRSEVRREQRPRGPGGQGFTQTGAAGGDDEEDPPLPPGHFGASGDPKVSEVDRSAHPQVAFPTFGEGGCT